MDRRAMRAIDAGSLILTQLIDVEGRHEGWLIAMPELSIGKLTGQRYLIIDAEKKLAGLS
jgi:hypothetical protein